MVVEETSPDAQLENSARLAAYVNERVLTIFTYQRIKTHGVSRNVDFEPAISGMPYSGQAHLGGWGTTH